MTECVSCKKTVEEVCRDGYCRECHLTISFEDCNDRTSDVRNILTHNPEMLEWVKGLYPDANYEKLKKEGVI